VLLLLVSQKTICRRSISPGTVFPRPARIPHPLAPFLGFLFPAPAFSTNLSQKAANQAMLEMLPSSLHLIVTHSSNTNYAYHQIFRCTLGGCSSDAAAEKHSQDRACFTASHGPNGEHVPATAEHMRDT
jgi:hypothetical protein